ncbi:MAG: gliding motility-associated C-terminal domain-containing protein [Saprospiraceae bacterium]|nr:gliding motility-associated C-terminal domain-containing protein [Saprospiraceae bacterium]
MFKCFILAFSFFAFFTGQAQVWIELKTPQGVDPCQGIPVEIRIVNEGNRPLQQADIQIKTSQHLSYRAGSLVSQDVVPGNIHHPEGPIFTLNFLDICESTSFQLWLEHGCALQSHNDSLEANLSWNQLQFTSGVKSFSIFSPRISIVNLGIVYDEPSQTFRKKYSIVNIGQLALEKFSLYVSGDDKMNILNSNIGTLSSNGDSLSFDQNDFSRIGNQNLFFERGESIDVIQEISLNACETDFRISHKLLIPCGGDQCEYSVNENVKLLAIAGTPRLAILQDSQIIATPCKNGEVNLRIFNTSNNGNFDLGNSVYNLFLNIGWSVLQGNQYSDPLRDNCLRITEVRMNGRLIPLTTNGFSGFGLDFRRLNTDPDGPGGLSDIDRDGFFDDLDPKDTLRISVRYSLDASCLALGCDRVVFDTRIFRIKGEFENYCKLEGALDNYISTHSYQWGRSSISGISFKGVYIDQETDTVQFSLYKNERNFLSHCTRDSAAVRIILPPVADLPVGAVILVNGKQVNYQKNANVITFSTDTANFSVVFPLRYRCDPSSGSGSIKTACTFCVGTGGPRYSVRIEADYFCGDNCYQRIPLFCGNSPNFMSVCNPNGGGQNSPGKLEVKEIKFKRITTGHTDSSKMTRINPDVDSIQHNYFFTYDTFLMYIPIQVLCNASFSNIFFRMAYSPRLYYNPNNQVDTIRDIQWISDTLKYFDAETNRWSTCRNPLGAEFYSLNTNVFYRNFVREVNLSGLFGTCLNGSLSRADSMVFVIRAVIPHSEWTSWTKTTLYADLTYNQDGCNLGNRKSATLNIFSGKPSVGGTTLRQDYLNAPDLSKVSPFLSVCGNFKIETSLDAVGTYAENPDPFPNEYRPSYLIEELKIVIPPFFEYLNNIPNYVRIKRTTPAPNLRYDTSYIQPSLRDSSGYTILEFSRFNENEDFELVQHSFYFYVKPECYVSHSDTIRVYKKFKYLRHHPDPAMHPDLYNLAKYPVNTAGVEANFAYTQKQILKDTLVSWTFDLTSKNNNSTPQRFFTYKNVWLLFENISGQIVIDSLVEYDSTGNRIKHLARTLAPGKFVYELDSLYGLRRFEMFTRFNHCLKDSLVLYSGNSCVSYPSDYDAIAGKCKDYVQRQVLHYEPEESSIRLELIAQPNDSIAQPCDSFQYEVLAYNSGLGHSFNNRFHFNAPRGLILREAWLEYPKDSFHLLPAPQFSGQGGNYFWDMNASLFPSGIPGFYKVDENYFTIHFSFDGNCDLEDGQSASFYMLSSNVCNQQQRSAVVSSDPFHFNRNQQNTEDLYDIRLSFSADQACGNQFRARCVLFSKNDIANSVKQKLYFIYAKELSFIPGSFKGIRHVDDSSSRFYYLDGLESVEVPLIGPIPLGDSAVFELELERTCIELCKTTNFQLLLNSEKTVDCAGATGGVCEQLLEVQQWAFDDIELSPKIKILDSEVRSSKWVGGQEILQVKYLLENKSPFTAKTDYQVRFYYDANLNGVLDTGDVLTYTDVLSGFLVEGMSQSWHEWVSPVPGLHSCHLIALVHPLDNPCLCTADTLLLNPALITGESQRKRICYDQDLQVGFESIPNYIYQWQQADRVDRIDQSMVWYKYPGQIAAGSSMNDTLYLMVGKSQQCFFYDTVFIEIYRLDANVSQVDQILCHGDASASIRAEGIGDANQWNFEWENRTEKTAELKNLGPGIYRVKVTDASGCAAFDSIAISEPSPIVSDLQIKSNYNGYSVSCHGAKDGAVHLEINGGTPAHTYLWSKGTGIDSITGLNAGWIKVKVLDKNNCPAEDSVLLTQPDPLILNASASPAGCGENFGGKAEAFISGGVQAYRLLWNNGDSSSQIRNLQSGKYTIEVTDANGCKTQKEVRVAQLPDPLVSANISDTTIEFGASVRLNAWTNAVKPIYEWSPSTELSCSNCPSVTIAPTQDQLIRLIVTDENGCSGEAFYQIRVTFVKDVWAPNVFSPNGDQVNDRFTIYGKPTLINIDKLQIYDRWGELVYEDYNLPPNDANYGWNGTFRDQALTPAVFVYVAHVRFVDGEIRMLYGDVTLIR